MASLLPRSSIVGHASSLPPPKTLSFFNYFIHYPRFRPIIAHLTHSCYLCVVRGNRPGKPVQLQEHEIKYLCTKAREIFINQPILLELEAPIKICGTHSTLYLRASICLDVKPLIASRF